MILYFSGTGNSAFVANQIGKQLSDDVLNLFDKIRNHDYTPLTSDKPWVVVTPTYAWQIPEIVYDWLLKTRLKGNRKIYFVMTCGDSIGAACLELKKLCKNKSLLYRGCAKIVMPENYIALFDAPSVKSTKKIIKDALPSIFEAANTISSDKAIKDQPVHSVGQFLSGPVNRGFNRFYVKSDKFFVKDSCISCGKCEEVCPLENISIYEGKPIWGKDCTHCMACICNCPKEAIEYGKISKGKRRYICPV